MSQYLVNSAGLDTNTGLTGADDSQAWKTLGKVNSAVTGTSDKVYFKCGDTINYGATELIADWGGTSGDHALISSYYLSGGVPQLDAVSGDLPVLNGPYDQNNTPGDVGGNWQSYVRAVSVAANYTDVSNIRVTNYDGLAFGVSAIDTCTFSNNEAFFGYRLAMIVAAGSSNIIIDNFISEKSCRVQTDYSPEPGWPGAVRLESYAICRNSIIQKTYGEGILSGRNTSGTVIEDNLCFANLKMGIYQNSVSSPLDTSHVRRNIILGSNIAEFQKYTGWSAPCLGINAEGVGETVNDIKFYHNLCAGSRHGFIRWSANPFTATNVDLYANTFVGNDIDFSLTGSQFSNCNYKNNIHAYNNTNYSGTPTGITFDYNVWPRAVTGIYSGANDVIGDAVLTKQAGWNALTAYTDATFADFQISLSSPAKDAGVAISGYSTTDQQGNSYAVPPSIGALEYVSAGGDTTPPSQPGTPGVPTNVTETSMDLAWTASTDETAMHATNPYLVYLDGAFFAYSSTNSYSATGLIPNTSHSWTIYAQDAAGNLSTVSGARVQATNAPTDSAPPTFSGATSAVVVNGDVIRVAWTQGTDAVDAQGDLIYPIYHSTSSGVYDFTTTPYISNPGVAFYDISDLPVGENYFVVRCKDVSENEDTNTVEVQVTVPRTTSYFANPRLRVRGT